MCMTCLIISVIGANRHSLRYFSCFNVIPSNPQLFFCGKPSIIFLIVSSSTSWKLNWLTFSSTLIRYDVKSLFVLLCISLARLEPIFVKYKLNLFAISNLSVTITCSSLKYVGEDFLFDLILSRLWFSMFFVNRFYMY